MKGDSETHPLFSTTDEFADFENWRTNIGYSRDFDASMAVGSYARGALLRGLLFERRLGVNPYKFGMIGSTDGHNAFSMTAEDNFFGKFPDSQPYSGRVNSRLAGYAWANWTLVASGYAAVWARENKRQSLFDALVCKEVYATTGSRITLRFFGGWNLPEDLAEQPHSARVAYRLGVPMGGDLPMNAAEGKAPAFFVMAAKDPEGANLDRIQLIKGWVGEDGVLEERVFDVVWSGERRHNRRTGRLQPVGSTVDVKNATFRNSIGAAQLGAVWTDPEFDPQRSTFYYARVLEIPKPRWTTHDAVNFGVKLPEGAPTAIQDRAYSSPIWYGPSGGVKVP